MVWWSQAGRQVTNNLTLAQITVEPLRALLNLNPSSRCSVPFWPLDALWLLGTFMVSSHPDPPAIRRLLNTRYPTGHSAPYLNG